MNTKGFAIWTTDKGSTLAGFDGIPSVLIKPSEKLISIDAIWGKQARLWIDGEEIEVEQN